MRWQDYLWLLLFSGVAAAVYFMDRKGRRRSKTRRQRQADSPLTRREQKAWHLLQAGGYRLEEIHPSVPVTMTIKGKKSGFFYEGNFIVSRGSENFLVKIYSGANAPVRSALRRDLLMDSLFFQTDGVLLYDEARGQLEEIRFAYESEQGAGERRLWKAALILLIVIGIAFLAYLAKGITV